jgi:ferric-dicitrate binding protein FerR (iron transport regulator)
MLSNSSPHVALALILSALTVPALPTLAAEEAGSVRELSGVATATSGATPRTLQMQGTVFVDDMVKTSAKARLALNLGSRTTLNLGSDTSIKIDRYIRDAGGEINLGQGTVMFERKGKPASSDLTVRSPYGLIAVRGTRFYAGKMADGRFGVLVGTGRVVVTGAGTSVSLRAGQGTFIAAPGQKPTAAKAWGWPKIREIKSAVE